MKLQDAEIIFADDMATLDQAYAAGAPRDAQVYTASPAMLLREGSKAIQHDKALSVARMNALGEETRLCSAALYKAVFDETGVHGLAITAARHPLTVQNRIYKAMSLTPEMLGKNVLVTQVQTGVARRDGIVNTPWEAFFPDGMETETFVATVKPFGAMGGTADPVAPFFTRLRFESLQSLGYRLGERLGSKAPWLPAHGNIWVAHESSLLKETAFQLFRRGYRIRPIPRLEAGETEDVDAAMLGVCRDIYAGFLNKVLVADISRAFLDECMAGLSRNLEQCASYVAAWRQWLGAAPKTGKDAAPTMLLHGFPFSLSHVGLLQACHDTGILTAGFQHGVSREISENLINIESLYENSLVQHYFTYNEQCATQSENNRLSMAQNVAVGLPSDLVKGIGRANRQADTAPILYPTTALYTCNMQLPGRACMNDLEKARFEIQLVENVFATLPHDVCYKPYNDSRYLDRDPVLRTVDAAPSVTFYDRPVDLRYIAGNSRVIVVSRATSTVAWCIMAHRPLVFIDSPDQPLSDEARQAFIDAFFYFDARTEIFYDALREFLSQPLDVIEALWRDKAVARKDVLAHYIGDQSCRAGTRAADHLIRTLKEPQSCMN